MMMMMLLFCNRKGRRLTWCFSILLLALLVSTRTVRAVHDEDQDSDDKIIAARNVLSRLLLLHENSASRHRELQQTTPPVAATAANFSCGEILDTFSSLELRDLLEVFVATELGLSGLQLAYFTSVVLDSVDFGVQIRKICASCADYHAGPDKRNTTIACLPEDYGYDALHSGLLLIPLESGSNNQIKKGSSIVNIDCHGTVGSNQDVPSNQWTATYRDPRVLIQMLLVGISGTFTIAPDYTGYGESSQDYYRPYVVRKSYPTSVLPLLWKAEDIVADETNCNSLLADSMVITGYSEGGYAAVAIADAMHRMGKTIIAVRSGGAPFRLSSVQMTFLVRQVQNGTFISDRRYFVALLGIPYSQTTTDVLNYGRGQDLLDSESNRTAEILDTVHSTEGTDAINELVPIEDPLLIYDQNVVAALRAALLRGEADPCVTSVVEGETDVLCQALQANDLVEVLEAASYPVWICHSVDDALISYDNLPDFSANPMLELERIEGAGHIFAGGQCALSTIMFFLDEANVRNVPVTDKSGPACIPSSSEQPSSAQNAWRSWNGFMVFALVLAIYQL